MNRSTGSPVWPVVHEERRALVRDLAGLTPAQWQTPSLCPGWDVHDVLAHLVDGAKTTRLGFLRRLAAAGFDFDRDNAEGIARERCADPRDTLASLTASLELTATPPAAMATRLVEAFVHGEDIRRPLGIHRDYPAEQVAAAIAYQVKTSTKMGGGKEVVLGWRLVAVDPALRGAGPDPQASDHLVFGPAHGPEVHGPAIALLLAVSGRPVGDEELSGPDAVAFLDALDARRGRG